MGQNALSEPDCKVFRLTVSPEHKDEKPDFLYVDTD